MQKKLSLTKILKEIEEETTKPSKLPSSMVKRSGAIGFAGLTKKYPGLSIMDIQSLFKSPISSDKDRYRTLQITDDFLAQNIHPTLL